MIEDTAVEAALAYLSKRDAELLNCFEVCLLLLDGIMDAFFKTTEGTLELMRIVRVDG